MINCIQGYPDCPNCNHTLSLRKMPGVGETYWHCKKCLIQWTTRDLLEILEPEVEYQPGDIEAKMKDALAYEYEASRWEELARQIEERR